MDKEYWKKRYQDKWKDGNHRERIIKTLLESWGYKVNAFGFEALSDDYNPDSPDEKGKPDFFIEINGSKLFFEVTGTNIKTVTPDKNIWLRPDKISFVKKHKLKAYCAHVLDHLDIIRFINMNELEDNTLIHPTIRGTKETYYEISPEKCISPDELKKLLGE